MGLGGVELTMQKASDTAATTEANGALAPAVSGSALVLNSVLFSADVATVFKLVNGTTHDIIFGPVYLPANGGLFVGPTALDRVFRSTEGEGIDWDSTGDGNAAVQITYEVA